MVYSEKLDKLICSIQETDSTGYLGILDPYFGTFIEKIRFDFIPSALALTSNQNFLYIGFENHASYLRYDMDKRTPLEHIEIGDNRKKRVVYEFEPLPDSNDEVFVQLEYVNELFFYRKGVLMAGINGTIPNSHVVCPEPKLCFGQNGFALTRIRFNDEGYYADTSFQLLPGYISELVFTEDHFIYLNSGRIIEIRNEKPVLKAEVFWQLQPLHTSLVTPRSKPGEFYWSDPTNEGIKIHNYNADSMHQANSFEIDLGGKASLKKMLAWGENDEQIAFSYSVSRNDYLMIRRPCQTPQEVNLKVHAPMKVGCKGSKITLAGDEGYDQYFWSTGGTEDSLEIGGQQAEYYYQVTTSNGCLSHPSDTFKLIQPYQPDKPKLDKVRIISCANSPVEVQVMENTHLHYLWSDGQIGTKAIFSESGEYNVRAILTSGCVGKAEVVKIDIRGEEMPPKPSLTFGDDNSCARFPQAAGPDGFAKYWLLEHASNYEQEVDREFDFVRSGLYSLSVEDANGCRSEGSDSFYISIEIPPLAPTINLVNGRLFVWHDLGVDWFKDNEPLTGKTTPVRKLDGVGAYTARNYLDQCPSKHSLPFYLYRKILPENDEWGTLNQNISQIYPNPFRSSLSFGSETEEIEVDIYDQLGRLVYEKNHPKGLRTQINTESWPSGIYFCLYNKGQKDERSIKLLKI